MLEEAVPEQWLAQLRHYATHVLSVEGAGRELTVSGTYRFKAGKGETAVRVQRLTSDPTGAETDRREWQTRLGWLCSGIFDSCGVLRRVPQILQYLPPSISFALYGTICRYYRRACGAPESATRGHRFGVSSSYL